MEQAWPTNKTQQTVGTGPLAAGGLWRSALWGWSEKCATLRALMKDATCVSISQCCLYGQFYEWITTMFISVFCNILSFKILRTEMISNHILIMDQSSLTKTKPLNPRIHKLKDMKHFLAKPQSEVFPISQQYKQSHPCLTGMARVTTLFYLHPLFLSS